MTVERGIEDIAAATERRRELRDAADHLLGSEWSAQATLALYETNTTWSKELWALLERTGWADLLVGGDGGVADLCVLAEAVGASTAPVPLATVALSRKLLGDGVVAEMPVLALDPLARRGASGSLEGEWEFVPYGAAASHLVTCSDGPDGVRVELVDLSSDGVGIVGLTPLDRSPAAAVTMTGLDARVLHVDAADAAVRSTRDSLTLAHVAELVGVAASANASAVAYAKERITFGRPIGVNQAIKHRLVDCRAAIETARALVVGAAEAVDLDSDDAGERVALAAFWAVTELRPVVEAAAQVFGGIGYTWEHDIHVRLRRAAVLSALLGPVGGWRDTTVDWLRRRDGL